MIETTFQIFNRWCTDNVRWQVVPVINNSNRKIVTSEQFLSMGLK